jgi:hypothetical protein
VGSIFALAMVLLLWPLWGKAKSMLRARELAAGG